MNNKPPEFLGDNWLQPEQGYTYASSPPPFILNDENNLHSDNDWIKLVYIIEKVKVNDRTYLTLLPDLINQSDDPYFCSATLDLIGVTGSENLLKALIPFMSHPIYDLRLDAYVAATMSSHLMFVEPLLEARAKHLSSEQGMINTCLSTLLEPEPSVIAEPMGLSQTEFEKRVKEETKKVEAKVGVGMPVFEGQLLDLKNILNKIKHLTQEPDIQIGAGKMMSYLHRFEAMTGVSCKGLFDEDGNVFVSSIKVIIETFEQQGHLSTFKPGQRYFFGYLIPSYQMDGIPNHRMIANSKRERANKRNYILNKFDQPA